MELNGIKQSIQTMLTNKKIYNVPRFQREYSWGENEVGEYFEDIIGQLVFSGNNPECSDYFIGSILLSGDYNGSEHKLDIVDGQQRMTTITIFLSAVAKAFIDCGEQKLADNVWKYIIAEDNDGEEYPIFVNETPYPYFQYYVQQKEKEQVVPVTDEELRIKSAYDFFCTNLEQSKIKATIKKNHGDTDIEKIVYTDLLKSIRDQILNSFVICIWTTEKSYVSSIFEILNAKGKKLASIDLIKNELFSKLKSNGLDDAKIKWKKIKENLNDRDARVDFTTFYRHYWLTKYKKVPEEKLYSEFKSKVKAENYKFFLGDLVKYSEIYVKGIKPSRSDYSNKQAYLYLVESLEYISDYFGITQTRVAFMALYDTKFNKKILEGKDLKDIIKYLEGFHYIYNAICSKRTNALETHYSRFAVKLTEATTKVKAREAIKELRENFDKIYPSKEEFIEKFILLKYSKKTLRTNLASKYTVNSLQKYFEGRDVKEDNGTIEHILSESCGDEIALNIGNLILLEGPLNEEAETLPHLKKIEVYKKSRYKQIQGFCAECNDWSEDLITKRAKELAVLYYEKILQRE